MSHFNLRCTGCQTAQPPAPKLLACPTCGAPLDAVLHAPAPVPLDGMPLPGVFRWWDSLPLHDVTAITSLGEGNTPLIHLPVVARTLGLRHLCAKLEGCNPTGSFKDRGAAVLVTALREMDVTALVEDSSGNAGSALAAYCARAGLHAAIFAPETAPGAKIEQIRVYGAELHLVPGPRDAATEAARRYARKRSAVYASHNLSPFFAHGMKSFVFEALDQLSGRTVDHIVLPVGNGSLLLGCAMAYQELVARGQAGATPRLHAIQSETVRPLAAAYDGAQWAPPPQVRTVAGGIAVARPPRAAQVVTAVRASGGQALAVPERAIVRWQHRLAREEGVFAEPTSAAAFAGLEALVREGTIASEDMVLVPVTGSGLKDVIPPE